MNALAVGNCKRRVGRIVPLIRTDARNPGVSLIGQRKQCGNFMHSFSRAWILDRLRCYSRDQLRFVQRQLRPQIRGHDTDRTFDYQPAVLRADHDAGRAKLS